jgi:enoyl-CoA hydratase/carnithine racemase
MNDAPPPKSWRCDREGDGVWIFWLDRPGLSQNVLDLAVFLELDGLLEEVERSSSVRGLILRSAKPAGFCAGADLKTIQRSQERSELETFVRTGLAVLDRLAGLRVPSAALIHGVCLGGGLELALACRFRVALASSANVLLGMPEVQLGLIPAWGGINRLPRLLEPRDALGLLLTGSPIGFLQAKSLGLVDRILAIEESARAAEILAHETPLERPLTPTVWLEELEFAQAKRAEQPATFPEVQETILQLIRLDVEEGLQASREATVAAFLDLAFQPATRQAIADFFSRRASVS